ncbi:MAG: TIM barrel protein [Acidobacteriota bacterium]|nr:TIM barrel protein [Acidobacteriota bacterium]
MNRREFTQTLTAAAMGVAAPVMPKAEGAGAPEAKKEAPFPLSVMLWTISPNLPFEDRLAKVADAGYRNVELVGEYNRWNDADYARTKIARRQLGVEFDATAGLGHGVADPAARDVFLSDLTAALTPMETLECPAMIVLSGNVVAGMSRVAQHAAAVETLKRAAEVVEKREIRGEKVRLLLECIDPEENPHYFLTRATEAIEIVRAVDHPQVQFLYDIFHEQIAEGNLMEKLNEHIDVIGLIHVADVPGRHQPGTGEINYGNIFRKLVELKYRQMVAMEFRAMGDEVIALKGARQLTESAV